jgi:uncharacterized protein (DUF362 family)
MSSGSESHGGRAFRPGGYAGAEAPASDSLLTRRDLLKALPLAVLAASCRRPAPYASGEFTLPARSAVALLAAADYGVDLAGVIGHGLRELAADVRGKSVLLKPNLVEYATGAAINTDPRVVAGAAEAFLRAGAREVVVGEGPGHRRDIEYLLGATGLGAELSSLKVRFVDLNHDDVQMRPIRTRYTGLEQIALPVALLRADFIVSMPKLKTHHWAAMTASMKNLFGVVPGAIYGWPKNILHVRGIENSILDLNATIRPHFTIVDAVIGMEGDGPIMGAPRPLGFVAMGSDLVAVDAECARIIGLDPVRIPYLAEASRFLGHVDEGRIDHRGERPDRYRTRFDVLPQFAAMQLRTG